MELRYFYDPGAGVCLWAADDEARQAYGYAVSLAQLPLPPDIIADGERLLAGFDGAVDWADPAGPLRWSPAAQKQFRHDSDRFFAALVAALGASFVLIDERRF